MSDIYTENEVLKKEQEKLIDELSEIYQCKNAIGKFCDFCDLIKK